MLGSRSKGKQVLVVVGCLLVVGLAASTGGYAASRVKIGQLDQWLNEPGPLAWLTEMKAAFEKENPDLEIEPMPVPYAQMLDKSLVVLRSGVGSADVVFLDSNNFPGVVVTGLLEPLDPHFPVPNYMDRFAEAARNLARYEGRTYAIPVQLTCRAFLYNEEMLNAKGVAVPKTPDELLAAAVKLTDAKARIYGYAELTVPEGAVLYTRVWQRVVGYGGNFAKDGKPTLTSPEVIRAVKDYRQMVRSGATPVGANQAVLREMFWNGQIAMINDGPWLMSWISTNNPKTYEHVRVTTCPTPTHMSNLVMVFYVIPKNAPHKKEAWKWLEFMSQPKWAERFMENVFSSHALTGSLSPALLQKLPWMAGFTEQTKYVMPINPPGLEKYSDPFYKIVSDYLVKVVTTEAPVEDIMADAQKAMEAFLKGQ